MVPCGRFSKPSARTAGNVPLRRAPDERGHRNLVAKMGPTGDAYDLLFPLAYDLIAPRAGSGSLIVTLVSLRPSAAQMSMRCAMKPWPAAGLGVSR